LIEPSEDEPKTRHPSLDDRFDPAITVLDYQDEWPARFELERAAIRSALGDVALRVEHVGSTAVPGLSSKPIVDIQVAVKDVRNLAAFVPFLEGLGYLFTPDPDSPNFHFFAKPAERPRRFHVHVCEAGSEGEERHLAVRDYLRSHGEEAAQYSDLKRELSAKRPFDRLAYIEGKEAYVTDLERRAVAWQGRRFASRNELK
jgi:GrpB-like predicted nucleotidyltransferase (UPF0157 family)